MRGILRRQPSGSMVVAFIALLVAMGGTGYAAIALPKNSVGTKQLKRNAVNSAKVKKHSLLRSDFKRGQIPRGPQGAQGIQGVQGPKGDPGTPATKLWAYVSATGTLRGGSGVVASSRSSSGTFHVTFNQSIVNCAATANYRRRGGDSALNVSNHFLIIQFQPTELEVYIWNSTKNQTMDIPFALIVAC
jgi:hypothetical protein